MLAWDEPITKIPSVGTPLSEVHEFSNEFGETLRLRGFVLGENKLKSPFGRTARPEVGSSMAMPSEPGNSSLSWSKILQVTTSGYLRSSTNANGVNTFKTTVARLDDGLTLVRAGSSL